MKVLPISRESYEKCQLPARKIAGAGTFGTRGRIIRGPVAKRILGGYSWWIAVRVRLAPESFTQEAAGRSSIIQTG